MNISRVVRALAFATMLAPTVASAAGYGIYEQGAAALGMGGAYVASAKDATAQFYNPAAMTDLKGKQLSLGGTWLSTYTSFAGVAPYPGNGVTEKMKSGSFFPPTFYWTNRLSRRLAYGVGVNAPFGLGVEWENPATFTGRDRVTKANLQSIDGSFSLAYALSPNVSVAGGLNARYAKVELNNIGTFITAGGAPVNIFNAQLSSSYKPGYGMHFAMLAHPAKNFRFGLNYRNRIKVKIDDGKAAFTQILTGVPALDTTIAKGIPANQKVQTELVFPASVAIGLAWDPSPDWTYEVDGVFTQWSAFQNLALAFPSTPTLNKTIEENYRNQAAVRVGVEHRLADYSYRFGYYFDAAAAPPQSLTPLLPDASRHGVTLGYSRRFGSVTFDAYNLFLFVEKRSTEGVERDGYNGVYKSYVNALGASLAFHW